MKKRSETAAREGGQRGQQRRSRDIEAAGTSSDGQPAAGAASSGAGLRSASPSPLRDGDGGTLRGPHSEGTLPAWFWGDGREGEAAAQVSKSLSSRARLMPGDSHHRVGIPGHDKTPDPSPKKKTKHQLPRGSLGRVVIPMGNGQGFPAPNQPGQKGAGGQPGLGVRLCWGWSCLSSVVKLGKDDPQLVSENAVFLGLLPGAL